MNKDVKVVAVQERRIPKRRTRDRIGDFFYKKVSPRDSRLVIQDNFMDGVKEYQKSSMKEMVQDLPDIRGAMSVIINAVVGNIKFVSADKTDSDPENKFVKKITKWFNNPEHDARKYQEQFVWSRLMRANVFQEISKGKDESWMYVCNAAHCVRKYNDIGTRVIGFDYTPPNAKKDPKTGKAVVQKYRDKNQHITSVDLLDGSEIGFPPLMSLIEDANLYVAGRAYVRALYRAQGLGRLAFIGEDLTPDEYESMKADLKERKGTGIALRGKIKIQNLSSTPKDMLFDSLDKMWAEKVMTVFSTPPVVMSKFGATGIKDDKSSMNAFGSKVRADKRLLEGAINQIIIKIFGPEYSQVRAQSEEWIDPTAKAERWKVLMDMGVITPNIVREELGLPKITEPWGDEPYNFNFPPQRERLERENQSNAGQENDSSEIEKFMNLIRLLANDYAERENLKKKFESLDYDSK